MSGRFPPLFHDALEEEVHTVSLKHTEMQKLTHSTDYTTKRISVQLQRQRCDSLVCITASRAGRSCAELRRWSFLCVCVFFSPSDLFKFCCLTDLLLSQFWPFHWDHGTATWMSKTKENWIILSRCLAGLLASSSCLCQTSFIARSSEKQDQF